jgi:dienelactone hydrolase
MLKRKLSLLLGGLLDRSAVPSTRLPIAPIRAGYERSHAQPVLHHRSYMVGEPVFTSHIRHIVRDKSTLNRADCGARTSGARVDQAVAAHGAGGMSKRKNCFRSWLRVLLFSPLVAAAPGGYAEAAVHIVDPWPDPVSIQGVRIEHVTFPSSSPFTPGAILRGNAPPTRAIGTLFLPPEAGPDHATPAVVLLHGAAGRVAERGAVYGPQLAAMGVAALVVDTFGARRDRATSFIGRVLNITETMFVADAYAALRYLAARPEIDDRRVVLAGFSWGGMAATYALYAQLADLLAPPGLRFAGHVAFYAPCIARFADNRTTGAPLLMLYGGRDELIRPDRCAEVAADLRHGGSAVTTIVYPEAVHQWDGGLPRMLIGRNLSGCRFRVERDGTVRDAHTLLPMNGPFLRKIILGLCVPNKPYPIGRDDAVRAQSNRDFGAFLARVFARQRPEPQSAG